MSEIQNKRGRPKKYVTEEEIALQREKRKEYQRSLHKDNPEKIKQYKKAYREKHPDKIAEFNQLLREAYKIAKMKKNSMLNIEINV